MTAVLSFLINVLFFIVLLPISIPMFIVCLITGNRMVMTVNGRRIVVLRSRN